MAIAALMASLAVATECDRRGLSYRLTTPHLAHSHCIFCCCPPDSSFIVYACERMAVAEISNLGEIDTNSYVLATGCAYNFLSCANSMCIDLILFMILFQESRG